MLVEVAACLPEGNGDAGRRVDGLQNAALSHHYSLLSTHRDLSLALVAATGSRQAGGACSMATHPQHSLLYTSRPQHSRLKPQHYTNTPAGFSEPYYAAKEGIGLSLPSLYAAVGQRDSLPRNKRTTLLH